MITLPNVPINCNAVDLDININDELAIETYVVLEHENDTVKVAKIVQLVHLEGDEGRILVVYRIPTVQESS